MKRLLFSAAVAVWLAATLAWPQQAQAQGSVAAAFFQGLAEGAAGQVASSLTGYAMSALGLNDSSTQSAALVSALEEIEAQLAEISTALSSIDQTLLVANCNTQANTAAAAVSAISNVLVKYTNLLSANPDNTQVSEWVADVFSGAGEGGISVSDALSTINNALFSVGDAQGIIAACQATQTAPATGTPGTDLIYYNTALQLLQYYMYWQMQGALMLMEAYHYQAYAASSYYPTGLTPTNAGLVCVNATGTVASNCTLALEALQDLYVRLQNQFSYNGVSYSTGTVTTQNGQTTTTYQTSLVIAGSSSSPANYLFVTSLEDFTSAFDPSASCSSPLTAASPCGIAAQSTLDASFPSSTTYQYESGWAPATAFMLRALLTNWTDSSQTPGTFLNANGFQNMTDKIILTPTTYQASVSTNYGLEDENPFKSDPTAACFVDTNVPRSFTHQPWCYNGSYNGDDYGEAGDLLESVDSTDYEWTGKDNASCQLFKTTKTILDDTNGPNFYAGSYQSPLIAFINDDSSDCEPNEWVNGVQPGWLVGDNNTVGTAYFWPALDVSDPTCGTNLGSAAQEAQARTALNPLGVPTMCGTDFDLYFSTNVAGQNPFLQLLFSSSPVSGTANTSATLPITVSYFDAYNNSTSAPTATVVTLTSTSTTGVFAATSGGSAVTTVTIPAGQESVTFYYGDSTVGTPTITATATGLIPGLQTETITSATLTDAQGSASNVGTSTASTSTASTASLAAVSLAAASPTSVKANGSMKLTGRFTPVSPVRLDAATLQVTSLLDDVTGIGELVRRITGVPVTPLTLVPRRGSKSTDAIYETPSGLRPTVRVEIKTKNAKTGLLEISVAVSEASMPRPAVCPAVANNKKKIVAPLRTRFSLSDGVRKGTVIDTTLPWECRGTSLKTP